jgi:hypothetical protein
MLSSERVTTAEARMVRPDPNLCIDRVILEDSRNSQEM